MNVSQPSAPIVARLPQLSPRLLRLESHLANLVNAARVEAGLHRLRYDPTLAEVCRAHSAEMRDLDYFEHDSPTPELADIGDRYILGFGVEPAYISENISHSSSSAFRPLETVLSDRAHASLMNSPGHRANILSYKPTHMGMGIVANANNDIWVTQMFSRP